MTVAECQDRVSSDEFVHWVAHAQREPFGIDWWQLSTLLAMFYNANRKKSSKKAKQEDFLPVVKKSKKRKTSRQLIAAWHAEVSGMIAETRENPQAWLERR